MRVKEIQAVVFSRSSAQSCFQGRLLFLFFFPGKRREAACSSCFLVLQRKKTNNKRKKNFNHSYQSPQPPQSSMQDCLQFLPFMSRMLTSSFNSISCLSGALSRQTVLEHSATSSRKVFPSPPQSQGERGWLWSPASL